MKSWTFLKHKASVDEDRRDIMQAVCGKKYKDGGKCSLGTQIEKLIHQFAETA
jgi:hypothetical protein